MKSNITQIILKILTASILLFFGGLFIFHHNITTERVYTYLPVSWVLASVLARIIVGIYLFLSAYLVFKKITLKTKIVYSSVFVFILIDFYITTALHNSLTPLMAIPGWVVLLLSIAGLCFTLFLHSRKRMFRWRIPEVVLSIGAILWILLVNPIEGWRFYQSSSDYDLNTFPVEAFHFQDSLGVESKEDVLVAFFSTTCPHCMEKARRLCIMYGNNSPHVLCYFPNSNNDSTMNVFFEKNGNISLRYQLFPKDVFLSAVQGGLPTIFRFKNGVPVEHFSDYSLTLPTLDYFGRLYD